jgi:predicted HAD superfamily hydrolase
MRELFTLDTMLINPLTNWKLDEQWIQDVLHQSKNMDVVTLDIFDTALTRMLDSPIDVFAEVEQRLCEQEDSAWRGYASERESAERDARQLAHRANGAEEIDLDQIYAVMAKRMPRVAKVMAHAQAMELQVERDVLVAVPDVLELTRRLVAAGVPYAFVSDMYLPSNFLIKVLDGVGYRGWTKVFVSCETQCTKSSGRQWAAIATELGPLDRVLHIGDDQHADVDCPRQFGVSTIFYPRARSERRVGAALTPDLLPFSRLQRSTVLINRTETDGLQQAHDLQWTALGRVIGGTILVTFLKWLHERVERHGIEKLYFCARDGSLIQRAWQAAGMDQISSATTAYLYVARRPLNLAAGYLDSSDGRLTSDLISFLESSYNNSISMLSALSRAGLGGSDSPIVSTLTREFGDIAKTSLNDQTRPGFQGALQANAKFVRAVLYKDYLSLIAYLRQEGLFNSQRHAMVDMGWHGSMQRSLQRLMHDQGAKGSLRGFYYGLWPAALRNIAGAGPMECAFNSPFHPRNERPGLVESVAILEELHMAPHGTVTGYRNMDACWEPVLADSPHELKQYNEKTRLFQDGALSFVKETYAAVPSASELKGFDTRNVSAMLNQVFLSPSDSELKLLGSLGHCSTYDHDSLSPIVPISHDAISTQQVVDSSEWPMGTLRTAFEQSSGTHRESIRKLAEEKLSSTSRLLRQFH